MFSCKWTPTLRWEFANLLAQVRATQRSLKLEPTVPGDLPYRGAPTEGSVPVFPVGGIADAVIRADVAPTMAAHRTAAGLLALGTIVLAIVGEVLVLAHIGGALGLILLVCGAASGIAGWVALGAPRTRHDISA
jgi:hypothetical protein